MPKYSYIAVDRKGEQLKGEQEAVNRADLEQALNSKGLILSSARQKSHIQQSLLEGKVKLKDLIMFSRQFSVMLSAGVTIQDGMRLLSQNMENKAMKTSVEEISEDLKAGVTLAGAMRRRKHIFDDFFTGMVGVGEYSGALEAIIKRVADFYEDQGQLMRSLRGALTYPVLLFIVALGVIVYMLVGVIPTFQTMFTQIGSGEMPAITQFFIDMSDFVVKNAIYLVVGAVGLVVGLTHYFRTVKGRRLLHKIQLKCPIVGQVMIKVITARFARSMDILTKSGVTTIESFDLVDSIVENVIIQERFKVCKEYIVAGHSYSAALEQMNVFPSMLISMVRVGESTGSLPEVFDKTSSFFDAEAKSAIQSMMQLIEPIMLVFLAMTVGMMFLAIMLPMFELLNQLG